jgi:hypothetical protein
LIAVFCASGHLPPYSWREEKIYFAELWRLWLTVTFYRYTLLTTPPASRGATRKFNSHRLSHIGLTVTFCRCTLFSFLDIDNLP